MRKIMKKLTLTLLIGYVCLRLFSATVSGFVTHDDSGEPMQFANVQISGTKVGGQTNKKGYYVLNLDKVGEYKLDFSMVSHQKQTVNFTVNSLEDNITVNVQLTKSSVELNKVVVTAEGEAALDGPVIRTSEIHRGREDIQAVVSPVEADVFRAVLTLPGVAPISDFSSGLYVRGGTPDQNLILLDDIDVYNPNHFGGVFSTFNADAVESINLIKGGYPAKYGGRLSSVLDVMNRDGNRVSHHGMAKLSLIASSATLEGPWKIGNLHGSYMGSIRRTYLELVKQVFKELPDYYFYDGQAKINLDLDARNKLSLSTYLGQDNLVFNLGSLLKLKWGNKTFSTQWIHLFNPQLFSQFVFAGSEFRSRFAQDSMDGDNLVTRRNGIHDLTAKGTLSWQPSNDHEVEGGFEAKWNNTWLKFSTSYQYEQGSLPDVTVSSLTSSAFVQDTWEINELWTLQPGLRASWYRSLKVDPGHIPPASYFNIEPRLSIERKLDVGESIFANFGAYHQYLTIMSMEISTPFDVWFPLDGSLDPGQSLHYILGYKRDLNQFLSWDMELYYKTYQNLLEYNTDSDYTWNNETGTLSDAFNVGKGYTYGADLMLRNDWNGLQGYIGYTLSQTKRRMDGVNLDPITGEPVYFYPRYDRSHSLSVVETYNVSQNTGFQLFGADLKLGLNFNYDSGQPSAFPERIYYDGENFQIIYSYKDGVRLPAYMRLDLSTKYQWFTRWGSIEPYLEIINVFGRKNVSFRDYNLVPQDDGTLTLSNRDGAQFPFLPFVGINVTW